MVETYDFRTTDKRKRLTADITLAECACRDGTPIVLVDRELLDNEQKCRDYFQRPIIIGSWYRTSAYNRQIGGAANSWHLAGMACDKDIGSGKDQINPLIVAMYDEAIAGYGGIGLYQYADGGSWVHNDTGPDGKYWICNKPGIYQYRNSFLPTLKKQIVYRWKHDILIMQYLLNRCGASCKQDGKFGVETLKALKKFQGLAKITVDGVCGTITWKRLFSCSGTWGAWNGF